MKRFLCLFSAVLLYANCAWAGATFSRVKTWSSGQVLTAADLNAEFDNILNYLTPAGIDDYSATTTAMRSTADPYPGSTESLATSLQGELERIRYQILGIKNAMQTGQTYWYEDLPTAGVFTVAGSSVGVNDTTPDYSLDVEGTGNITGDTLIGGTLGVTGVLTGTSITASTMTSSQEDVSITTHVAITGNLSVGGTATITGDLNLTGSFAPSLTHIQAYIPNNQTLADVTNVMMVFTEIIDSLGEMGTSTFTVTNTGYYHVTLNPLLGSTAATISTEISVRVNGALHKYFVFDDNWGTESPWVPACSGTFYFTAGDAVSFWVEMDTSDASSGALSGSGDANRPTLYIDRLY